jgi:hypothetical protein
MTKVDVSPLALPLEIVRRYVPVSGVGRNAVICFDATLVMVSGDCSIHTCVPSVKLSPMIVSVCVTRLYDALVTMRLFGLSAAIEAVHITRTKATTMFVRRRALTKHLFRE